MPDGGFPQPSGMPAWLANLPAEVQAQLMRVALYAGTNSANAASVTQAPNPAANPSPVDPRLTGGGPSVPSTLTQTPDAAALIGNPHGDAPPLVPPVVRAAPGPGPMTGPAGPIAQGGGIINAGGPVHGAGASSGYGTADYPLSSGGYYKAPPKWDWPATSTPTGMPAPPAVPVINTPIGGGAGNVMEAPTGTPAVHPAIAAAAAAAQPNRFTTVDAPNIDPLRRAQLGSPQITALNLSGLFGGGTPAATAQSAPVRGGALAKNSALANAPLPPTTPPGLRAKRADQIAAASLKQRYG